MDKDGGRGEGGEGDTGEGMRGTRDREVWLHMNLRTERAEESDASQWHFYSFYDAQSVPHLLPRKYFPLASLYHFRSTCILSTQTVPSIFF